tara:strand:- start:2299 stop:2919 length:621 start_codon:yes stop_codon:yes gene_type:complete
MAQIEQDFRMFLAKRPEIEKAYAEGLINRRALARYLIKANIAKSNQMEAVVAMLRRFDFSKSSGVEGIEEPRINVKDKVLILDFERSKDLLQKIQQVIAKTNYDKGDTLKLVVGSASIKLFIDESNEKHIRDILGRYKPQSRVKVSELSLFFDKGVRTHKGVIAYITRLLQLHEINLSEVLTSSPELLIYVKEEFVLKAYEVLKDI